MSTDNPLLIKSTQAFGTEPFDEIEKEHFLPALTAALSEAEAEIEQITNNSEAPSFENTILALELSGSSLNRVSTVYFHLFGSESDQEFQDLAMEISPKLAKFSNDISLNKSLFERVKLVFDNHLTSLNEEDARLTENCYKGFVRNGAMLEDADKQNLRSIDEELSTLSPKFSNNSLNATNSFEMWLNEEDLEGLPSIAIESAKIAANEKGIEDKWLITLQMPSYLPFMKHSSKRDLREKLSKASATKCNGGEFDNSGLVKNIAKLKHQRVKLLGYDNYADYVLEKRMAESQRNIFELLDNLYEASYEPAKNELKQIQELAKEKDGIGNIKPWDTLYYSEKLKQKLFDFDDDALRPYFKSENVINGVFQVAHKLYGLTFTELENVQTYHEAVRVYEVTGENDEIIGILYEDLFPRATKRAGAWMNELRSQGMSKDGIERPHVCFSCNLTPSTDSTPSLLTMMEVETIFHEFGHCLHGLLSNCKYKSMGGTSVYWDFVELPSQILENWLGEKETLNLFAHHFETGETIPDELTQKIKKSKTFLAATKCLRQLSLGYLDLAWYGKNNEVQDVEAFEIEATKKTSLLERTPGSSISCSFAHIFAGGYSAGYYSYKWAEVLEADAFEKFLEDGIFNKETAMSFRDNILSKGNSKHPMELFKAFRGREPRIDALLKREGLADN